MAAAAFSIIYSAAALLVIMLYCRRIIISEAAEIFEATYYTLTCSDLDTDFTPCLSYLIGTEASADTECCTAVGSLLYHGGSSISNNSMQQISACQCLTSLANTMSDVIYDNVVRLPQHCGGVNDIHLPFTDSSCVKL